MAKENEFNVHRTTHEIPLERFKEENLILLDQVFPSKVVKIETRKVSSDCYVSYLGNKYSVPYKFAGRPKKPKIVPSDYLKYAQVVKTRKNGVLEKVEKNIIFGKDIEQSEISTTLLERQNLTFRQDNNRVSRKTIGFSKMKEWLEYQVRLYCTHFYFCRGHGGLRYKDERGVECKNTPAREVGLLNQSGI